MRFLVVLLAMLALASACAAADPTDIGDDAGTEAGTEAEAEVARTTIVPTMRPTSAEDLGIAVDRDGRPYDNYWGPQGSTADIRFARTLNIAQGRLEIIDGDAVTAGGPVLVRDTKSVDFRGVEELDLSLIWQKLPSDTDTDSDADGSGDGEDGSEAASGGDDNADADNADADNADGETGNDDAVDAEEPELAETILGVVVQVPDTTVARWGEFQRAYQTNQGLGAVTSRAALEWSASNLDDETPLGELGASRGAPFAFLDVDDDELDDLFLFDNGTNGEPGTYFLSRGLNEDDIMVAIIVWHGGYPWRLAVPTGDPPPDITEREEELIACIEGLRLIDKWGRCT